MKSKTQRIEVNRTEENKVLKELVDIINLTKYGRKNDNHPNVTNDTSSSDSIPRIDTIKSHRLEDVYLWHLSTKSSYCLCEAQDLPNWHFQHRQLNYGYRPSDTTFTEACFSIFYFHNEFINIWLHYLGTIALVWKTWSYYQQYRDAIPFLPLEYRYDFYVVIVCVLMGNCFPIFTSGLCHHFYCMNQGMHRLCWYLDFVGMLSGITFVSSNFLYLTFYCLHHPDHGGNIRTNNESFLLSASSSSSCLPALIANYSLYHLILTILLGAYILAMILCWKKYKVRLSKEELFPKDRFPEFSSTLTFFSVFTYLLAIGCSVYFNPQYLSHPVLSDILVKSCLYPLGMAMGIVIFAQGSIPERFHSIFGVSPHFFDLLGHSHQLWHVASLLLLYHWIDVIFHHYEVRHNMTCPLV